MNKVTSEPHAAPTATWLISNKFYALQHYGQLDNFRAVSIEAIDQSSFVAPGETLLCDI